MQLKKEKAHSIFIILSLLYLISRFIYLDADLPNWSNSFYSPIDEFYYTLTSFNLVEGVHVPGGRLIYPENMNVNFLQQILTAGSLFLFGDNYYGLRVPSILAGFVVIISFYALTIKRLGFFFSAPFFLMLVANYSFILATRTAEPTIFRMAAASILILYVSTEKFHDGLSCLLTGFLTGLAWFFVYPSNAFLALFGAMAVIYIVKEKRIIKLLQYCIGLAICLILYVVIFGYESLSATYFSPQSLVRSAVQDKVPFDTTLLIPKILLNIEYFFLATFFTSHPWFMYLSLVGIILIGILLLVRAKFVNQVDGIIVLFFLSFAAQTLFFNDYPQRKLVFILPVLLYFAILPSLLILLRAPLIVRAIISSIFLFIASCLFVYPSINYIYKNPEYKYKMAMYSLNDLNGFRLIGGWSFGFRLYNNYLPYLTKYSQEFYNHPDEYYKKMWLAGKRGDARHTLEYHDETTIKNLAAAGFFPKRMILKSNDPMYSDVYLYEFEQGVQ